MNYAQVLTDAWKTIWRNKAILAFGLMSGVIPGLSFALDFIDSSTMAEWFSGVDSSGSLVLYVLLALLLVLATTLVVALSQIGIVRGTALAQQGAGETGFRALLTQSLPFMWRVLGVLLLFGLVLAAVIGMASCFQMGVGLATLGFGMVCLLPFVLGLFLLALAWRAATDLTITAVVVDGASPRGAISQAWKVFRRKTGPVTVFGLALTGGLLVSSLLVGAPDMIASWLPAFFTSPAGIGDPRISEVARWFRVGYFPIHAVGQALLQAYAYSAWTLAYLELTRPPGQPMRLGASV
ncbi:MAG: hypothetical protein AB1449_10390 [Chloroflexota bacterium]